MSNVRLTSSIMAVLFCSGAFIPRWSSAQAGRKSAAVTSAAAQQPTKSCVISRIIDGDTIECVGKIKIRLIGVDAPEKAQKPFGAGAAVALAAIIPVGSTITLEYDASPRDRYRRLLAYVWNKSVFVNEQIVRAGWAIAEDYPPNTRHSKRLHIADSTAQAKRVGMWESGQRICRPSDFRSKRC